MKGEEVRISSRGCTREVWRAQKKRKSCSPNTVNKIFPSHQRKTKTRSFSRRFFHMKIFLLLKDRKSQIPLVKALQYRVVEMGFS